MQLCNKACATYYLCIYSYRRCRLQSFYVSHVLFDIMKTHSYYLQHRHVLMQTLPLLWNVKTPDDHFHATQDLDIKFKLARDFTLSEGFSFGPFQSRERKNTIERPSWLSLIPQFSTILYLIIHLHLLPFLYTKLIPHHSSSSPSIISVYTYPPPSSLLYLNEEKTSFPTFHGIFVRHQASAGALAKALGQGATVFLLGSRGYPRNDVLVTGICQAIILICWGLLGVKLAANVW